MLTATSWLNVRFSADVDSEKTIVETRELNMCRVEKVTVVPWYLPG